jgi:bifunctional DNase/RNase
MLIEAEIWTIARTDQGNAVLVRPVGADVAVPIFIGQPEAQSILIGMGNVPMPRPLTHDLFLAVLKNVGVTLERIEITALKEGTFYAQLVISADGKEIIIDARPSDSLAIAVRHKCKIYIADAVVDEAGVAVSKITEETSIQEAVDDPDPLRVLQTKLDKAVAEENYEEAAVIRDQMKELDKEEEK